MKTFEALCRFIGCLVLSYVASTAAAFIIFMIFDTPATISYAIIGGGTVGAVVYYYQRRKIMKNNFVQSC